MGCSNLPDNDEIIRLIHDIPDHRLIPETERSYSEEYYKLLKQAWDIPSDGVDMIGSEEWLFYFVSGNDEPINNECIINSTCLASDTVNIYFTLYGNPHTLKLIKENSKYVICDFDDTALKLKEYIKSQRDYFRSDDWKNYLKQYDEKTIRSEEQLVRSYFDKYPD